MVSFPRVINLIKSQHLVRPPVLARSLGIGFALILAAFILRYIGSEPVSKDGFIIAPMLVAVIVFAELYMFKPLKDARATIFYLAIPASTLEKWLANLISSFLLLPLMVLIGCYFANFIAYLLASLVNEDVLLRQLTWWDALKLYWSLHPILFFGAIYFRTGVLFKTFGSAAVLFIASILLFLFAMILAAPQLLHMHNEPSVANGLSPVPLYLVLLANSAGFQAFLTLAYFGYFWGLSLLRLREVEI